MATGKTSSTSCTCISARLQRLGAHPGVLGRSGPLGASPAALWRLWDSFGIEEAVMIGWWEDDIPIKLNVSSATSSCDVSAMKSTVYVNYGKQTIVVVASWCGADASVSSRTRTRPLLHGRERHVDGVVRSRSGDRGGGLALGRRGVCGRPALKAHREESTITPSVVATSRHIPYYASPLGGPLAG